MDYGKFLYELAKKEREAKKAQKVIEVKEIRLRPKTDDHHRGFKVRDGAPLARVGMKVKVRVHFRGREISYPDIARQELASVADEFVGCRRGRAKAGHGRPDDAHGAGACAQEKV